MPFILALKLCFPKVFIHDKMAGMLPDQLVHSEIVFQTERLQLRKDAFLRSDGKQIAREWIVHHPAAVIVPVLEEGKLVMVEQFRAATGQVMLEFPAGIIEPDEDPIMGAARELVEETGYTPGVMTPLLGGFPAPGFCNEYLHFFVARELILGGVSFDHDEDLETVVLTYDEIDHLIQSGKMVDLKSVAAYLYFRRFG